MSDEREIVYYGNQYVIRASNTAGIVYYHICPRVRHIAYGKTVDYLRNVDIAKRILTLLEQDNANGNTYQAEPESESWDWTLPTMAARILPEP